MKFAKSFFSVLVAIALSVTFLFASPPTKSSDPTPVISIEKLSPLTHFDVFRVDATAPAATLSTTIPDRAVQRDKFALPGFDYATAYRRIFAPPFRACNLPMDDVAQRVRMDRSMLNEWRKPEIVRKS